MAKADVTLKFDAETAAAVQKLLAVKGALEQTADASRKLGETGAKAGGMWADAMKGATGSIVGNLGLVTSVSGAAAAGIALLFKAGDEVFQRMEKRAEHLRELSQSLSRTMGNAGQSADTPVARAGLKRMAAEDMGTLAGLSEIYTGISDKMGNRLSVDEKLNATKAAAHIKKSGMDTEHAIGAGVDFGMLDRERRPGGKLEGTSDDDLREMAFRLATNKPDGMSDKDVRFLAHSKDKTRAVDMLAAAAQSDESSKALTKIQEEVEAEHTPEELRKKSGPEGRRIRRLMAIPENERYDAVFQDPTLLPESDRASVKNLTEGMNRLPHQLPLREVIAKRNAVADPEMTQDAYEKKTKAMESQFLESPEGEADRMSLANSERVRAARQLDYPNAPGFVLEYLPQGEHAKQAHKEIEERWREMRLHQQQVQQRPNTQESDPHLEVLQDIHQSIQDQHKTQQEQVAVQRTRRDTVLSNDSEGQK